MDAASDPLPPLLSSETLARLEGLVRLARRTPAPRQRRRRRPGRGIEPGARRDYTPGDDVRLVDWAAYARLERLLVKVTEDLPEPRLDLLLDGSASMGHGAPTPAEWAGLATAGLAAAAVAREVRVSVTWCGAPAARLRLSRPGELVRLLRFLHGLRPAGPGRLAASARQLAQRRGRGAAALLSDGLQAGDASEAARRLRGAGYDVWLLAVTPAAELSPQQARAACAAGRVVVRDAESGAAREVPFAPRSLEQARARRRARLRDLAAALEAAGVPYQRRTSDEDFEAAARQRLAR